MSAAAQAVATRPAEEKGAPGSAAAAATAKALGTGRPRNSASTSAKTAGWPQVSIHGWISIVRSECSNTLRSLQKTAA